MAETLHWRCISGCGSCCRLDPGERNEAGSAAVFVLEVGFDQQASVLHFDTKAFKTGNKYLLFFSIKHVLRVKN